MNTTPIINHSIYDIRITNNNNHHLFYNRYKWYNRKYRMVVKQMVKS